MSQNVIGLTWTDRQESCEISISNEPFLVRENAFLYLLLSDQTINGISLRQCHRHKLCSLWRYSFISFRIIENEPNDKS